MVGTEPLQNSKIQAAETRYLRIVKGCTRLDRIRNNDDSGNCLKIYYLKQRQMAETRRRKRGRKQAASRANKILQIKGQTSQWNPFNRIGTNTIWNGNGTGTYK